MTHSSRPRQLRFVAAAVAFVTAAAVLPASAAPQATQAPSATASVVAGDDGLTELDIPGLNGSRTVTLVTGDQVTLTADGARYVTTAQAARRTSGVEPTIEVRTRTDPQGRVRGLTATPDDVRGAVAAGVLDQSLFDLGWLLEDAKSSTARALSVTVKYDDLTGDELRKRTEALPGTSVSGVHPSSNTVDLTVDSDRAAQFWAKVAPDLSYGDEMAHLFDGRVPELATGIRKVWRTGHRSPVVPQVDTEEPTQTVTVRIHKEIGDPFYCVAAGARVWILCLNIPTLISVDGRRPGTSYQASAGECLEPETCSDIKITYEVPAGKYMLDGDGTFRLAGKAHTLNLMVPEFEVAGDRTLWIDGDSATRASVETPRPNQAYGAVFASFRTFADGWGGSVISHVSWARLDYWAVASPRVTEGKFHLSQVWMRGKPLVSMSVAGTEELALHPSMSGYEPALPEKKVARFEGHHRAELVDVGLGLAEDFEGRDVKGKLVLMRLDAGQVGGQCDVKEGSIERAKAAGALGALIEPFSTHGPFPETECWLPLKPAAWGPQLPPREVPDLPWAALPMQEINQLRGRLAEGPVEIDVDGFAGTSPWNYHLQMYQYGRIPASMHTRLSNRDLRTEENAFHDSNRSEAELVFSAFNPSETVVGGLLYQGLSSPSKFNASRGPVTPDLVWRQWPATNTFVSSTLDVVDEAGTRRTPWNSMPVAPGVVELPGAVFAAHPGKWEDAWAVEICTFCREGDTFFPTLNQISGAAPGVSNSVRAFAPENVRLFADGSKLPQEQHFFYGPSYQLPKQATDYRLVAKSTTTATTWRFRSRRTSQARAPQGFLCPNWFSTPGGCQFEPMLFLRYRTRTDLHNAVRAGTKRTLVVDAYRALDKAPRVKSMRLWVSANSGRTWQKLSLNKRGGGEYAAKVKVPAYRRTDGFLALKAVAKGKDGGVVRQRLIEAVPIKK